MERAPHITLSGAPEGFDARALARELDRGKPVIHVARDDKRMEAMRVALAFFGPDATVISFPAWDCLPYDRISPNPDVAASRMATLATLARGLKGPFILLTTLSAVTQRLPSRDIVNASAFTARVGERVNEAALRNYLVRMGFTQIRESSSSGIIRIIPMGTTAFRMLGQLATPAERTQYATLAAND